MHISIGDAPWQCTTPEQVIRSVSNDHFVEIVQRWHHRLNSVEKPEQHPLPLGVRRSIAKAALGFEANDRKGFAEAIARCVGREEDEKYIEGICRSFDKESKEVLWTPDLIKLINLRLYGSLPVQRYDFQPIYPPEFNDRTRFCGPNAPFTFCRRLLGLQPMAHWQDVDHGVRGAFDATGRERMDLLGKVEAFVTSGQRSTRPCLVVHSNDYRRGLSALAGDLLANNQEEPGFWAVPRCLLYASPNCPPHKGVDLPFFLRQILAFYDGHFASDAPSVPDYDVRRDIDRVRAYMSRYPAVFIVDGVQDVGPDLTDLRAAVLDDPFRFLIQHLLNPDIGSARMPASAELFAMNKFVILANGPCLWLTPMVEARHDLPPPSPLEALDFIEHDGAYLRWEQLVGYFDSMADPRAGAEPYLQCADLVTSLDGGDDDLPPPGELADRLVESLARKHPAWLRVVLILLLAPGGIRPPMLFRLLAAWPVRNAQAETPIFGESELAQFRMRFGPMILTADDHTLMDALSLAALKARNGIGSPHETLMFLSPATAALLSDALLAKLEPLELAQIQALLASEALDQHTRLMRLAERDDHSSIRLNRRLLQSIYHALQALSFAPEDGDLDTELANPISQRDRFYRVYAMFYRLLLEAPPNWEMSRVMGAESVKRDLLTLMLATGQPLHDRSGRLGIQTMEALPDWVRDDARQNANSAVILLDLLTALGQSLLQTNEFARLPSIFEGIATLVEQAPTGVSTNHGTDTLVKLRIDHAIQQDRLLLALVHTVRALRKLGLPKGILAIVRDRHAHERGERFPMRQLAAQFERAAPRAISFVQRWAEILAISAEARLRHRGDWDNPKNWQLLADANSLFQFADALRWVAFRNDPFARAYVASGHATRTQVRILLLMNKQPGLDADIAMRLRDFARHRVDTLTRTFARYPAERPSLLILDSILRRIDEPNEDGLLAALDVLIKADSQMIWAKDRPRVRMRLLFERVKLFSRLAALNQAKAADLSDDEDGKSHLMIARNYGEWARHDMERLKAYAEASGSALWQRIAAQLRP